MAEQRLGLIMHGVTGRMGYNQHLVRSILAIGPAGQEPVDAGRSVVVDLPSSEVRSLDAYRIENLG